MTLNKTLWAALVAAMACGAVSAVAADATTTATTAAIKKKAKAKSKATAAALQKKKAAAAMKPAAPAAAATAAKPASVAVPVAEPAVVPAAAVAPAAVAVPAPAPAPVVAVAAPAPAPSSMASRWLSNVYAGGNVGQSRWKLDGGTQSVDESGNTIKLFVGHRYNDWLAAEVGFVSLGKSQIGSGADSLAFKSSGLFADAVGNYTVYPQLDVIGRVGATYMDNKVDLQQAVGGSESGSKKSFGLKYGAGLQYRLMPQLSLRGEVESYPYKSATTTSFTDSQSSRVTAVSIGAAWKF